MDIKIAVFPSIAIFFTFSLLMCQTFSNHKYSIQLELLKGKKKQKISENAKIFVLQK